MTTQATRESLPTELDRICGLVNASRTWISERRKTIALESIEAAYYGHRFDLTEQAETHLKNARDMYDIDCGFEVMQKMTKGFGPMVKQSWWNSPDPNGGRVMLQGNQDVEAIGNARFRLIPVRQYAAAIPKDALKKLFVSENHLGIKFDELRVAVELPKLTAGTLRENKQALLRALDGVKQDMLRALEKIPLDPILFGRLAGTRLWISIDYWH